MRPFVMPGSSVPSSSKVFVNIGTATVMMTRNTIAATTSTSAGYVRALASLALVFADLS